MSNYQKFTLQTIREKLKNGDYASLVGANRAIGKTQELSDADKVKAKAMAAKHFGVDPSEQKAAKAPTAKRGKKAKKKAAKAAAASPKKTGKRAKKAAKKTAKKAGKSSAKAGAAAPSATLSDAASVPIPQEALTSGAVIPQTRAETIDSVGKIISTLSQALTSMELAKRLFPKADLEAGVVVAAGSMARAVRALDAAVLTQMLPEDKAVAKAAPSKPKGKKGRKAKAAASAPEAPAAEPEVAESEEEELEEVEGEASEPEKNGVSHLSPEELEQLEIAKRTQPAAMKRAGVVPRGLVSPAARS